MSLVLRLENYDRLEDGGPVSVVLTERPLQVGRGGAMDWVLPDPTRHLSGHHFDVAFRDGAHWLTDVSTNGTFLQGQRYRLDGPHRLQPGDRFQVGPYIVVVETAGAALSPPIGGPGASAPAPPPVAWASDDDPWAVGGALDPVDPMPVETAPRRADFADEFISPQPSVDPPAADPFPEARPPRPLTAAPRPDPAALPAVPQPQAAAPAPAATPAPALSEVVAAFCQGAGLDPGAYPDADALDLVRQAGAALRAATDQVMPHLAARAAFKEGTRAHVDRTMAGLAGNPLKTAHHPERALEELFLRPRAGAVAGADAVGAATRDLRLHHAALIAALQPALAAVVLDLAPEALEAEAGGGILSGSRKAKAWEAFVARWDAKTAPHENGMLDEFFAHLAAAYADALKTLD